MSEAFNILDSNYCQSIGDEFLRLRGRGFALSAMDTELVAEWQRAGVPLHIPLNALASVEEYQRRKPELRVRGLAYISEEVDAQFAELLERHVGCGGCEKSYCARRPAA